MQPTVLPPPFPSVLASPRALRSVPPEVDDDGRCGLQLGGELDLASTDAVISLGRHVLEQPAVGRLIVGLAGVTFVDAAGLGALVALHAIGDELGKPVVLDRVPARVEWLLRLTGLESLRCI